MHEAERRLRDHMAGALRAESHSLTRRWIEQLSGRLDVDRRDVLPTDYLLDHVPDCLERIGAFIGDPRLDFPLDLVRDEMSALVRLRRSQGFGVRELLAEYDLLAGLLQEHVERSVDEVGFDVPPGVVAAVVGQMKDAFACFGLETARSYRIWTARERRERALQSTTFAAMLRHELRNRLGSAKTAAELLGEREVPSDRRERLVDLILRSLDQALETVDVVKGIMADETASDEPPAWLPLGDLLHGLISGSRSAEEGVNVEIDGVPDVRVPGARVSMILLNLIDNAIKYHDDGKDARWVRITAEAVRRDDTDGEWARIVVADNGSGIDAALHETIFDFTVRADDTETGSGLGLALSREIAGQLGGRIDLESERGAGTRVTLIVPSRRS